MLKQDAGFKEKLKYSHLVKDLRILNLSGESNVTYKIGSGLTLRTEKEGLTLSLCDLLHLQYHNPSVLEQT